MRPNRPSAVKRFEQARFHFSEANISSRPKAQIELFRAWEGYVKWHAVHDCPPEGMLSSSRYAEPSDRLT